MEEFKAGKVGTAHGIDVFDDQEHDDRVWHSRDEANEHGQIPESNVRPAKSSILRGVLTYMARGIDLPGLCISSATWITASVLAKAYMALPMVMTHAAPRGHPLMPLNSTRNEGLLKLSVMEHSTVIVMRKPATDM